MPVLRVPLPRRFVQSAQRKITSATRYAAIPKTTPRSTATVLKYGAEEPSNCARPSTTQLRQARPPAITPKTSAAGSARNLTVLPSTFSARRVPGAGPEAEAEAGMRAAGALREAAACTCVSCLVSLPCIAASARPPTACRLVCSVSIVALTCFISSVSFGPSASRARASLSAPATPV